MLIASLALWAASTALAASPEPAAASLHVDDGQTTFAATVTPDDQAGYRIAINCAGQCRAPTSYSETVGDTPLGLFSRDQDDLILSLWSGGSAYRVRVWSIADGEVGKIAELSSRGRPEFLNAPDGGTMIRTFEAESGVAALHEVNWTSSAGRFVRSGD